MKTVLGKFGSVLAVALALASAPAKAEDMVDAVRARGVLRIPGILNEDPYFNKDPRTGEWRGFAIEMARDIAKTIGVKLEVVESTWPNSILDVQSGKADLAFGITATPQRALSVAFSQPTYFNSFVIVSPKPELSKLSWAELNDPKYTFAVDLGSSQDLIAQQYLPKAKMLRFKSRDEAIVAIVSGKADGLVNTMLNGLVMSKKAAAIGKVMVPQPVLSTPSVVALSYATDDKWKAFISAWAEYNRRIGNNQTWIVKSLEPFGITLDDMPEGFGFGG
jgi:polar amino acid transport system substrate-binding protein